MILGICLTLMGALHTGATPPSGPVFLPGSAFTLAWTHSIEKVRWEEDYEVRLTRSEFTADYDWCSAGRCQPLSNFIASSADVTRARACFYQ